MNEMTAMGSGLSAQDERTVSAVLVAYGTSIDQRDWNRLRACFSEDCEADYDSFGKWQGAVAIAAYMKQAHADLGPTLHRITTIEIRSDDGRVSARSYVDALLMPMNAGGPSTGALAIMMINSSAPAAAGKSRDAISRRF
jgi:hypothetical protein